MAYRLVSGTRRGRFRNTAALQGMNRTPNIAEMIKKQRKEPDLTIPPPDEPYGALNLSWPPTVPYVSSPSLTTPPSQEPTHFPCAETKPPNATQPSNPVYARPLGPSEIRLLRIPVTPHRNTPLHLSLEIYDDQRHPEYEATSYTWAGEDGDDTLCRPVYIGDHWDVVLQTTNCWSMLNHLRPRAGTDRILWVDAICINQTDLSERAAQVGKMGLIYRQCRQVVVYLGADIVKASPSQPVMELPSPF